MHAGVLKALVDYLNARTLPGKPYALGPGIAWSVVLPRQNSAEDLKATLSDGRLRTMVGVIMPAGSSVIHAARGGYGPDQPRGGAVREMQVYLTIFARSLKGYAYDGLLLEYEDVLQELLGDFSNKDHPAAYAASLSSLTLAVMPPDFTILEFTGTVRYKTVSRREAPLGVIGGVGDGGGSVLVPGPDLTKNTDGSYTLPDGTVVRPNPDGSYTLPDGTVVHPQPDGGVDVPGTVVTPSPNGTVTLPDGTVVRPNPDGSLTLPGGTVIPRNPDGSYTLPGTVIVPGEAGPTAGERRSGLLHFTLQVQPAPESP